MIKVIPKYKAMGQEQIHIFNLTIQAVLWRLLGVSIPKQLKVQDCQVCYLSIEMTIDIMKFGCGNSLLHD